MFYDTFSLAHANQLPLPGRPSVKHRGTVSNQCIDSEPVCVVTGWMAFRTKDWVFVWVVATVITPVADLPAEYTAVVGLAAEQTSSTRPRLCHINQPTKYQLSTTLCLKNTPPTLLTTTCCTKIISLNHIIDWDHAKAIDKESNRMDRWIREAMHIKKKTRQVDEPRRGVLSTSTRYLLPAWLQLA